MDSDSLEFHRRRASEELHIGLLASDPSVARAHLTLSSLHFGKVRDLQRSGGPVRPLLTM